MIDIVLELVEENPIPANRSTLVSAYRNLGIDLEKTGRYNEAANATQMAIDHQIHIVAEDPNPSHRILLARFFMGVWLRALLLPEG